MMKSKFTLIEVLVALGVFMVGVAPVLGLLLSATRYYQEQVSDSSIGPFAQVKLSELQKSSTIIEESDVKDEVTGLYYTVNVRGLSTNNQSEGYSVSEVNLMVSGNSTVNDENSEHFSFFHIIR